MLAVVVCKEGPGRSSSLSCGIARALLEVSADYRPILKAKWACLNVDPRTVERKTRPQKQERASSSANVKPCLHPEGKSRLYFLFLISFKFSNPKILQLEK
jgi:hypothetical protein